MPLSPASIKCTTFPSSKLMPPNKCIGFLFCTINLIKVAKSFFVSINFEYTKEVFLKAGAVLQVDNSSELEECLVSLIDSGDLRKELGDKANGRFAEIQIIEIPDDVEWEIDEYDGVETVREKNRSW